MNRSRLISGVLVVILLVCGVVIFLDQNGVFSGSNSGSRPPVTAPSGQPTTAPPTTGDGYGDLK